MVATKTRKKRRLGSAGPHWNLKLLYASPDDPQIEKDAVAIEATFDSFAQRFDGAEKPWLKDEGRLLAALTEYEKLFAMLPPKPLLYFSFLRDTDSPNPAASSAIPLFTNRFAKAENRIRFFEICLGKIQRQDQERFLESAELEHFRFLLSCIFDDAEHALSVPEEKVMSLKSQPAHDMWIDQNERILNAQTVPWKGKPLPLPHALNMIQSLKTAAERRKLASSISVVLKSVAPFSEGEINALATNKKINDELRGYSEPAQDTIKGYRNDPKAVRQLVETVTDNFHLAHRFYAVKARLMGKRNLAYCDRAAKIGSIGQTFSFDNSLRRLKEVFGAISPAYAEILDSYVAKGQLDVPPRVGKTSGAYCASSNGNPTFVLLNHIDDLDSFTTFAHEMGHAFHGELCEIQGPIYSGYSTALAETASTLFETMALDAVFEKLSDKEKIVILHDKINDDISSVFRQIACFNYENAIHRGIRSKGFLSHEQLADLHNEHMRAYLGPKFKLHRDDGYFFVSWSHLRRFFYVYTYSYGQLVSKAMLRRYRNDPSFWTSIEKFLSAGGKDTPENILREIGIDVSRPSFWEEGLKEIEKDIEKLEKLAGK